MFTRSALGKLAAFLPACFAVVSVGIKTGHHVAKGRYIIGLTTTVPTTTTTTTTTTSTTKRSTTTKTTPTTTTTTPTTTTTSTTTTPTTTTTPSTTSTTGSTSTTKRYSYGRQGIKGDLICLQNKFTSGHFCCIRGVKDAEGEPVCDYFPRKTETRCFTLGVVTANTEPFAHPPVDFSSGNSEGLLDSDHEYDEVMNSTCCSSRKIGKGLCCTDGLSPNLQAMVCSEDGARTENGAMCF